MELLVDRDPSIIFLTETWLTSDCNLVTSTIKDYGYKLLHNRRINREKETGGGVGILLKQNMSYKHIKYKIFSSFELTVTKIALDNGLSMTLACIYRLLFIPINVFLVEIALLIEKLVAANENLIIAGDVNIHMDSDNLHSNNFKDTLNIFNATQHVDFPTHIAGHTLDIVTTFKGNPSISKIKATQYDLSHHFLVEFQAGVTPKTKEYKTIYYRNVKTINYERFNKDIGEKLNISESKSLSENINSYNEVLTRVLDKHAPLIKRTIKLVPNAKWFDSDYEQLRRLRRKAERTYHRSGLPSDKDIFRKLRRETTNLAYTKKKKYYSEKLGDGSNSKTVFSVINKLIDRRQETVLPDSKNEKELADSFLEHFTNKIETIRKGFDGKVQSDDLVYPPNSTAKLLVFDPTTPEEIRHIVSEYLIKCSPMDPLPADILRKNIDFFIPIWVQLVNISLSEGNMDSLKSAILLPLIKEMDGMMDKDNMKNYRPVSNLVFIGKLIERVVSKRLKYHMSRNNLNIHQQYGYKKNHSTETLLLKIVNDLLQACDNQMPSVVMLLDLSAAFDTVDQEKLLNILHDEIGIEGIALKWFKSFLHGRSQSVKIGNSYSDERELKYGVPQGSISGPDLFNIYMRSFYMNFDPRKIKTNVFGFADDHQLYKKFLPILQITALGNDINNCFSLISKWMNEYFLCLNPSKTKILIVAPPSIKGQIIINGAFIKNSCVRFVNSAKNLGVILDNELSFKDQILIVVNSCFNVIRNLTKIKNFLSYSQLRTAISACVFSKIDYCNSLYYGIDSYLLDKLQNVQNSAARLLRKKSGNMNISSTVYIKRHHWLCVKDRISFKICLTVHKCLLGKSPEHLASFLKYSSSSRTMNLIQEKYSSNFGRRSFSCVAPRMWNLLPLKIRTMTDTEKFKVLLKTFLFDESTTFWNKLYLC